MGLDIHEIYWRKCLWGGNEEGVEAVGRAIRHSADLTPEEQRARWWELGVAGGGESFRVRWVGILLLRALNWSINYQNWLLAEQ